MIKSRERSLLYLWSFFVAFVCLTICSRNSFFYPINDWVDAQALFTTGKGIVHGNVLYRDIYEHKGPFIYMLNALCALLDSSSMIGVFFLEVLSFGVFLAAVFRFLQLYEAGLSAYLVLPPTAMVILSSVSFLRGGSAEEYALPMLAWSLYFIMQWAKTRQPMHGAILLLNGILFGLIFWMKFTMVGFYVPWLLVPVIHYAVLKQWKNVWRIVGFFALGFALSTLPWIVYFGVNHSIGPWLQIYMYDNIFVYGSSAVTGSSSGLGVFRILRLGKAIFSCFLDWFIQNTIYSVPLAIGLIWFTIHQRGAKLETWLVWLLVGFSALGIFFSGTAYLYYGLLLASFAGLFALAACRLINRCLRLRGKAAAALSLVALLLASAFCYFISPNTGSMFQPREETLQYRIAAIVHQTPNATLLNYSAMDVGFYTACNIVPTVRYFHKPNVPIQEIMEEQNHYVVEGVTDYVVVELVGQTLDVFKWRYDLVTEIMGWSLYRLKGLVEN